MPEDLSWLEKLEKERLNTKKNIIIEAISTGYDDLNSALGVNGIPRGKIIEIAGHPKVGKTALALDIVAHAQMKNLQIIYFDLDEKFDTEFAYNRGVKLDDLLVFRPDKSKPENTIVVLKQLINDGLIDLIVIDTISQFESGIELFLTEITKLIAGTKVTVVLTSQIRNNFDDPRDYNTPFMKVLNEYSNIRMMLKKIETLSHDGIFIGKRVSVNIYKNCLSHPKTTDIEIYV
jgi:recombination protein RecA